MTLPRVIALLPTFNRPEMAHRAVHLFLEQDYAGPRRLVAFDDGDQPVVLCSSCEGHVELVRHDRVNLPTKRNRMMAHARDPEAIYFMWDDDDYHGPGRVRRQVEALRDNEACILRPTLYYNQMAGDVRVCSWVSDATVAYRWSFWSQWPFDERLDPGSGYRFVCRPLTNQKIVELHGELDYVTVVHAGQRHSPPAFGPPHFTDAPVDVTWVESRLKPR